VDLNRAVALAMAFGPAVGLELVDELVAEGALAGYHLLPSVRGDFLFKLDRFAEARGEFLRAASLAQNARERKLLLDRASACDNPPKNPRQLLTAVGSISDNRDYPILSEMMP